ncbi:serine/threonine-protein kinase [Nocardia sp. alder85J]|uniref:serine/threonine-protein kinase n=1 Tax=Nocardia sp. alder85J TaxID=2862949 RepID=UPI001CD66B8C|nr:serine/threonine-protein kinase [Nocardia sp. alder85J]MCX4095670.1 protein kinase [Nocardia sp. alder85J]
MAAGIVAELTAAGFDDPQPIGRGGFGVVYCCYDHALERHVAIKLLLAEVDDDDRARFIHEQHILGRLSGHPHIVPAMSADITVTGRPYIVMPYYPRRSLDNLIRQYGPLSWPDVASIGVKLAGALATAHGFGIVHRDVKPANILLTEYHEPQLSDFGVAQLGEHMSSATIHGTPAYTAPEILCGASASPASDIYSLGATLFSLLTGNSPFARRRDESIESQLARISSARLPDLREHDVPKKICAAIEESMALEPTARPTSAAAFGENLRDAQRATGQPVDTLTVLRRDSETGSESSPERMSMLPPYSPSGSITSPPPPMAATKFRPPTTARTLIGRERLLHILRNSGRRKLLLVNGPAGFGKTTLAAQWARELENSGTTVAWLTVDRDDDNVVWFLAHLVAAIRRVRPDISRELAALLEQRSSDVVRSVLSALIDEIHDYGQDIVLVVDDWHRVHNDDAIAAMNFLLQHSCHHLRIMIVGRSGKGLASTKLLVEDEVIDIDVDALRFDRKETDAFLVEASRLPLSVDDITKIQASTEGWPAALQLAQLSLTGRDDPKGFIDNLTGRHHVIGDYLAENVLDSLEPTLLEFLMTTSITTKICAGLATALSNRADSPDLLNQIADRNLFLQRMDDEGEWFRYHRLFADYLQRRSAQWDPDRVTALHLRASEWFSEHRLIVEALDHALAADAVDRAIELVEANATDLVLAGRTATFLGLMDKLPVSWTDMRPRLQLCVAWADSGLHRGNRVTSAVRKALAAVDASDLTDHEVASFRTEAMLVTGLEQYVSDNLDGIQLIDVDQLKDLANPIMSIAAADLAAADALNRFDYAAVYRWQQTASRFALGSDPIATLQSHCIAGLAALDQLDVATAEHHFTAALGLACETELAPRAAVLAGALLGELRYEQGRIDEACELLGANVREQWQPDAVDFLLPVYATGARVAYLHGNSKHATELLDIGEKISEEKSLPRLSARLVNERIRIGLPISNDLRKYLSELPTYRRQTTRIRAMTRELEQDSAIRLMLAEGSPSAVEIACRRAEALVEAVDDRRRPRAAAYLRLLYADTLRVAGHSSEADRVAAPTLALIEHKGLHQVASDTSSKFWRN